VCVCVCVWIFLIAGGRLRSVDNPRYRPYAHIGLRGLSRHFELFSQFDQGVFLWVAGLRPKDVPCLIVGGDALFY